MRSLIILFYFSTRAYKEVWIQVAIFLWG